MRIHICSSLFKMAFIKYLSITNEQCFSSDMFAVSIAPVMDRVEEHTECVKFSVKNDKIGAKIVQTLITNFDDNRAT